MSRFRSILRATPLILGVVVCLAAASCSEDDSPRPGGKTSGDLTVNGSERIGWDQQLDTGARIADYSFAAYVDSGRQSLDASCQAGGAAGSYSCSAPLPAMSTGRHTLRLVATRQSNGQGVESERSESLVVVKVAGASSTRVQPQAVGLPGATVAATATGLGPIADLAVAPDGRVFVAERTGRVLIVQGDPPSSGVALTLSDTAVGGGLGLFAIALPADFARTRHVYLAYAASGGEQPAYKLIRAREVNGELGEVAVLLQEAGAQPGGWMAMRFGPDGKLYAAVAARRNAAAGSYLGKILRLNPDASTPRDHTRATPVVGEIAGVRGLGWLPDGSALVATEVFSPAADAPAALSIRRPSASRLLTTMRGQRVAWLAAARPAGLAVLPSFTQRPDDVEMLAGMIDGGVQRFRLQSPDRLMPVGDRLLPQHGAIRAVAVAPGGVVYAGTSNGDAQLTAGAAPAEDMLLRIVLPRAAVE